MALPRFWRTAPRTIYACTAFLNGVQFVMCCSGLWRSGERYVSNRWTRLYSLGMAALLLSGLMGVLYAKLSDPVQRARFETLDKLVLYIADLELFMSMLMFVVTTLSMQRHARQYALLFDAVHSMDQRLQAEFGAQLHYHKLLRKNCIVVSLIVGIYVCGVCSGISQMAHGDFCTIMAGAFCYTIITGGPHLSGYVHMNLVEVLKIRFRLLQQLLNRDYLRARFPQPELRQRRIWSAIEIVKELHRLIDEINDIYKHSLIVARLHDFTLTTSELYLIVAGSLKSGAQLLVYVVLSMLPPVYKMTISPIYCDLAVREGRQCLRIVEEVDTWLPKNGETKALVSAMMLWRLQNKPQFTLGLNIPLNKTNMTIVVSVVINYLLILIQFQMTEEMGDNIEYQKNVLHQWIGDID